MFVKKMNISKIYNVFMFYLIYKFCKENENDI